jgi:hypothetical protein
MNQNELIKKLFGDIDFLELEDWQQDIVLAPEKLAEAEKEIERLRGLVYQLANDELSPAQKKLLLVTK